MILCVDDLLMKNKKLEQHTTDLVETFTIMQKYKVKLNPMKYTFELELGKFVGFMVSKRIVEANLEKTQAIINI